MKAFLLAAATAATTAMGSVPVHAANVDVGVSVQISQPGVYGRIDIGRFPQPQVVLAQPVIIRQPMVAPPQPVYMWVPPGHRKNWRRHCGQYQACGVPVYFVRDDWYGKHVRPHGHDRRDDRRGDRRDERRDRRDDGRGPGRGRD